MKIKYKIKKVQEDKEILYAEFCFAEDAIDYYENKIRQTTRQLLQEAVERMVNEEVNVMTYEDRKPIIQEAERMANKTWKFYRVKISENQKEN